MTGSQPYEDLSDDKVEARYSQQIFPPLQGVHCGEAILACWCGEISTAKESVAMVQVEMRKGQLHSRRSMPPTHDAGGSDHQEARECHLHNAETSVSETVLTDVSD